ncbi:MAG: hypothetical protein KIS78_10230 [Labilithrix sp.]|nr:hypothetical protein [Labilithrix sp.]
MVAPEIARRRVAAGGTLHEDPRLGDLALHVRRELGGGAAITRVARSSSART